MKLIFNFKKVFTYPIAFILIFFHIVTVHHVLGAESQDEYFISLQVENKRLGDVLKIVTLDTGFEFELNDQWVNHPVNASIENMPLHRGLKIILKGLNHAVIYKPNKVIKIMVYGKADSQKTDSYSTQSMPSQIQDNQHESAISPESSIEEVGGLKDADNSSEETSSLENTDDKSAEGEDTKVNGRKENSQHAEASTDKESDQDAGGLIENTNEQESFSEDAIPEGSQK
jgi:hypothetical protein